MAETTLQLGFVPKERGEYTSGTTYYKDNIVQFNGSSYIADPVGWSELHPTDTYVTIAPTDESGNLNAGWKVFASGNNTFTTGEKVNNVGIDNEPTAGSNNLVKSRGIKIDCDTAINNLNGILEKSGYLYHGYGTITENVNFRTSNYIKVNEGDIFIYNGWTANNASIDTISCYDSSKTYLEAKSYQINGYKEIEFTIPNGVSYIRVCARTADNGFKYFFLKSSTYNVLKEKYEKIQKDFDSLFKSGNLINSATLVSGKYIVYYDGSLETNINFSTSDFIPVEEGEKYYISPTSQSAFYNAEKVFCAEGSHNTEGIITIPTGAKYIRISTRTEYVGVSWIFAKSEFPVPYEPYKVYIDYKLVQDREKFASVRFNGIINASSTKNLAETYVRRETTLSAKLSFSGTFSGVEIGRGPKSTLYSSWIEINGTTAVVKYNQSGTETTVVTLTHGLNITDFLAIIIVCEKNTAYLQLSTNAGFYKSEPFSWFGGGKPFLTNLSTNSISAILSFIPRGIKKPIWVYQDSYGNYWQNWMWPYYILENNLTNWLGDNLTGAGSSTLFAALKNDLMLTQPKYVVWALGMNDNADPDTTTPNSSWLTIAENVKALCQSYGIEPVFCTIPSVPSKLHDGKNYWIKNQSGCRYIDLADAVGAQSSGTWYDGMINSDQIHPSVLGAKVLAERVMIDFPEISTLF